MKRFLLIIVLIAVGAGAGYFYSDKVYSSVMNFYFTKISSVKYDGQVTHLAQMLEKKDYAGFEVLYTRLVAAFPEKIELYRLAAPYYLLVKGDMQAGSYCFRRALLFTASDMLLLDEGIPALYFGGMYGDIEEILRRYTIVLPAKILYYRGASLCKIGDGEGGLPYLLASYKTIQMEDVDRFIGSVYEKRANSDERKVRTENLALAETYYARGVKRRPFSEDLRLSLLRVYHLQGKAREGAELMRYGKEEKF